MGTGATLEMSPLPSELLELHIQARREKKNKYFFSTLAVAPRIFDIPRDVFQQSRDKAGPGLVPSSGGSGRAPAIPPGIVTVTSLSPVTVTSLSPAWPPKHSLGQGGGIFLRAEQKNSVLPKDELAGGGMAGTGMEAGHIPRLGWAWTTPCARPGHVPLRGWW